jgi:hypothetical protein
MSAIVPLHPFAVTSPSVHELWCATRDASASNTGHGFRHAELCDLDPQSAIELARALLKQAAVALNAEPQVPSSAPGEQAPRFSAAQLAEVEARYVTLLATEPTAVEGCALTEPVEVTIGQPGCDETTIGAQIAMWADRGERREFIVTVHVTDLPVELNPREAGEAAEKLRHLAAALDTLATDAEALATIEAQH